jgi:hypothetical protein
VTLHDEPTEQDKVEDLERQYANLRTDPETKIFCPWCRKINAPGKPSCCPFFVEAVAKIGQRQLASVEKQLREVRLGSRTSIQCPYCGAYNRYAEHPADWMRPNVDPFCCDLMHDAALAISQRQVTQALVEQKKKIEDGIGKAERN